MMFMGRVAAPNPRMKTSGAARQALLDGDDASSLAPSSRRGFSEPSTRGVRSSYITADLDFGQNEVGLTAMSAAMGFQAAGKRGRAARVSHEISRLNASMDLDGMSHLMIPLPTSVDENDSSNISYENLQMRRMRWQRSGRNNSSSEVLGDSITSLTVMQRGTSLDRSQEDGPGSNDALIGGIPTGYFQGDAYESQNSGDSLPPQYLLPYRSASFDDEILKSRPLLPPCSNDDDDNLTVAELVENDSCSVASDTIADQRIFVSGRAEKKTGRSSSSSIAALMVMTQAHLVRSAREVAPSQKLTRPVPGLSVRTFDSTASSPTLLRQKNFRMLKNETDAHLRLPNFDDDCREEKSYSEEATSQFERGSGGGSEQGHEEQPAPNTKLSPFRLRRRLQQRRKEKKQREQEHQQKRSGAVSPPPPPPSSVVSSASSSPASSFGKRYYSHSNSPPSRSSNKFRGISWSPKRKQQQRPGSFLEESYAFKEHATRFEPKDSEQQFSPTASPSKRSWDPYGSNEYMGLSTDSMNVVAVGWRSAPPASKKSPVGRSRFR